MTSYTADLSSVDGPGWASESTLRVGPLGTKSVQCAGLYKVYNRNTTCFCKTHSQRPAIAPADFGTKRRLTKPSKTERVVKNARNDAISLQTSMPAACLTKFGGNVCNCGRVGLGVFGHTARITSKHCNYSYIPWINPTQLNLKHRRLSNHTHVSVLF
jgi:hypothetical protein